MRTARVRMATLCSLLPVKYCRAAPKLAGESARTSTCRPSRPTLALALFSPCPRTSVTPGQAMKRSSAPSAAGPVTSRSRSPTVSRPRRRLPAGVMASTPGVPSSAAVNSAAMASAVAEQVAAAVHAVLGDAAQHLLLELGAHARQHAQLLFQAQALQLIDGADAVVLEDQGDALGAESLDLQEFQRGGRESSEQQIAPLAASARHDFPQREGQPLADAGNGGDRARGVVEDVHDALRISLDGGRAVAIAADAERVLGGDLHQIGGFLEDARDFLVFQAGSWINCTVTGDSTGGRGWTARVRRGAGDSAGGRGWAARVRRGTGDSTGGRGWTARVRRGTGDSAGGRGWAARVRRGTGDSTGGRGWAARVRRWERETRPGAGADGACAAGDGRLGQGPGWAARVRRGTVGGGLRGPPPGCERLTAPRP